MKRIVLDTSVLVSGLLKPTGPPARILSGLVEGRLLALYDARILDEYRRVLLRPRLGLDPETVAERLRLLRWEGEHVTAAPIPDDLPDPGDRPFIEVVRSGAADALVTGNHKHFPSRVMQGVPLHSPRSFVDHLRL